MQSRRQEDPWRANREEASDHGTSEDSPSEEDVCNVSEDTCDVSSEEEQRPRSTVLRGIVGIQEGQIHMEGSGIDLDPYLWLTRIRESVMVKEGLLQTQEQTFEVQQIMSEQLGYKPRIIAWELVKVCKELMFWDYARNMKPHMHKKSGRRVTWSLATWPWQKLPNLDEKKDEGAPSKSNKQKRDHGQDQGQGTAASCRPSKATVGGCHLRDKDNHPSKKHIQRIATDTNRYLFGSQILPEIVFAMGSATPSMLEALREQRRQDYKSKLKLERGEKEWNEGRIKKRQNAEQALKELARELTLTARRDGNVWNVPRQHSMPSWFPVMPSWFPGTKGIPEEQMHRYRDLLNAIGKHTFGGLKRGVDLPTMGSATKVVIRCHFGERAKKDLGWWWEETCYMCGESNIQARCHLCNSPICKMHRVINLGERKRKHREGGMEKCCWNQEACKERQLKMFKFTQEFADNDIESRRADHMRSP